MQEHHVVAARPRRMKRVAALAAFALMLTGLAVAGAPAAQANHFTVTTFESDTIEVEKNGKTFFVNIDAFAFGGEGAMISISFAQRKNPDGILSSRRGVSYSHNGAFSANHELSSATAKIGSAGMGSRGIFDLDNWDPTGALNSKCGGDQVTRNGVFRGTVNFKSGEAALPNLSLRNIPGRLFAFGGEGCGGGGMGCPTPGVSINLYDESRSIFASTSGDTGLIFANRGVQLANGWTRYDSVDATVPDQNVSLNQTLKSGKIQGAPGLDIRGRSDYSSPNAAFDAPWQGCRGGKEYRTLSTFGSLDEGLFVDFLIGGDWQPKGDASGNRTQVRAAG